MSWVQNVETVRSLSAMRVEELRGAVPYERTDGRTTGGPVVAPAAVRVANTDEITAESNQRELTLN